MEPGGLLVSICAELREAAIDYVIVGDTSGYPETIKSDVDFVVRGRDLRRAAHSMAALADRVGWSMLQQIVHDVDSSYFVLGTIGKHGRPLFLHVDLCADYRRRGRLLLPASQILRGANEALTQAGRERGFRVPAPAEAFLYYLLKRVDKADFTAAHGEYLSEQWREDAAGCKGGTIGVVVPK